MIIKYCGLSSCGNHALPGKTYCANHQLKTPDTRANSAARGYNSQWQKIRTEKIRTNPFCEICEKEGKEKLADMIHHIKTVKEGGTNEIDNLQSLCLSCHRREHEKMKRGE